MSVLWYWRLYAPYWKARWELWRAKREARRGIMCAGLGDEDDATCGERRAVGLECRKCPFRDMPTVVLGHAVSGDVWR